MKLPYYITDACLHQGEGARNIQRRDQNNVILGGIMENYPIDNEYI